MITKEEFIDKISNTNFILIGEYKNTKTNVEFKCKVCGDINKKRPGHILSGSGCSKCSGIKKKSHKEYITDLLEINRNIICIGEYKSASKKIKHKCLICNFISDYIPNNLLRGQGCSKCANNQKLTTKEYELKLENKEKRIIVTDEYRGRSVKIQHLCLVCNSKFYGRPSDILKSKSKSCPTCSSSSNGESIIINYLESNNLDYIKQYRNSECKNKRPLPFDFYIPKLNVIVEFDGIQHFYPNRFGADDYEFFKIKTNDDIKNSWCLKNNIKLIRIPYFEINRIVEILDDRLL